VERALKDLINDKIETKCFEEALWIIKLLKKGDDQIDALNLLGVAQSQLGLTLEAKTVFDEACKLAQSIGDSALVNIAEAQIQAGLFKEAKDTACLIWSNNDKAKVLIEIASRQIVAGLDIEAMVNLDEIECVDSDDPDPEILGMLAVAKAQAGHFKKAKEIAISIWNRPERELTLREIAAIQARFGRYDEAIETVKSMKEEVFISWALKSIATEQVQSDLFNDAKRTASLMTSSQDVMTIVGAIAAKASAEQKFSEALRTLESHDSREFVQEFTSWKSILEVIELGLSGCLLFQVIDILGWTVLPFRKSDERLRDVRN
jgi:tetratricopeptide (TPR) repeat protein